MYEEHLRVLACPACLGELVIQAAGAARGDAIETGTLRCSSCSRTYPIIRSVPRFVPTQNYASNFGLEWTRHAQTQYDRYSGVSVSERRFFGETGWDKELRGEVIAEVGSGSGRFTEQAASTGALVVSMDYSYAVEANQSANGGRRNVCIIQGDIYKMPIRRGVLDKVFCFGVLQHTPDPRKSFLQLPHLLKPGGDLVVDIYRKGLLATYLQTKYYVRPFTRNMDPERLYAAVSKWVDTAWPLSRFVRMIPRIGPSLNWRLLIGDYSKLGLAESKLKEWAILDTFDMLSPRYDSPQTLRTVHKWFEEAGLMACEVKYGYNGIEGKGRVPRL